jgi:uncharacterized protein YbbC (DUF1343 family)
MRRKAHVAPIAFLVFTVIIQLVHAQYEGGKNPVVKPGIDMLLEKHIGLIKGKKVGLITNPTGVNAQFISSIDLLYRCKECKLVALFGPEHGIRGDYFGGERVENTTDTVTGVRIYSLYPRYKKPTPEMLKDVEVLLYDIQDTGNRGYTYIYTMAYAMMAAKENDIPIIILDRPNPLGGNLVDGNVLDPKFSSFIGMYPIAYLYGMTPGELAMYFNKEFDIGAKLKVVKMDGWKRSMKYWDTGLPWVPPSTHIPRPDSPFYSAVTGIMGELHTVNEGVGYTLPFEVVGAPWINPQQLANELNRRNLPGVYFRPISYEPKYFAFANQKCHGVQIHIINYDTIKPVQTGIHIMEAITTLYPEHNIFQNNKESARIRMFDLAMGTDEVRIALERGASAEEIINTWQPALEKFLKTRDKYLLYK